MQAKENGLISATCLASQTMKRANDLESATPMHYYAKKPKMLRQTAMDSFFGSAADK